MISKNLKILLVIAVVVLVIGVIYLIKQNETPVIEIPYGLNPEKEGPLPSDNLIHEADYLCEDGTTLRTAFYVREIVTEESEGMPIPTGMLDITLSDGRSFYLPQTISASGIRYADEDEHFLFWGKGDKAFIMEDGEITIDNCQVIQKTEVGNEVDEEVEEEVEEVEESIEE